ncbi:Cytochrome P450 [Niveomyces insectorum RCEF 264]|uniref:Cytochrome P450 n=1 Tax=Niveomyces insectorum RCEF 264 TaxID=1081102 RepID=A0A167YU54_9HYPO|nr:Cytochrome P450 [Niveomyces insectorum RCEF 264]
MQPAVAEEIRKHAASFMRIVKDSPVLDVYAYSHYYVMDAITGHVYGPSGTKTLTETEHRPLVYDLSGQKHRTRLYLHHYLKSPMAAISTVSSLWRRFRTGNDAFHVRGDRLNAYGRDSVESARSTLSDKNSTDVCSKLLRVTGNCPQTAAECMDHMVAGVDTTGDALCVLMWQLSLPESRHIQEKLFEELRSVESAFDAETMTAPITLLDSLPYLDAVIREGLRWRAPVPMTLFRVVPHGGRTISGVPIPAQTVVGCQAYSIHQLPDVFEAPDRFVPDRWLTEDQEKLNAMRAHFWPFSSGARHCLGHNIAMVEMKHLIASVYTYYKTSTTPECTEASMAMDDQLTSGVPYGLKCVLAFEKR